MKKMPKNNTALWLMSYVLEPVTGSKIAFLDIVFLTMKSL
jgi:hypothetical protein